MNFPLASFFTQCLMSNLSYLHNRHMFALQSYMLNLLSTCFKYVFEMVKKSTSTILVDFITKNKWCIFKIFHITNLGKNWSDFMEQINITTVNLLNHTMKTNSFPLIFIFLYWSNLFLTKSCEIETPFLRSLFQLNSLFQS